MLAVSSGQLADLVSLYFAPLTRIARYPATESMLSVQTCNGKPNSYNAAWRSSSPSPAATLLPSAEYLPGKRAFSINLMIYHTIAAGSLFQAPRFIPVSFGTLAER